MLPPPGTPGTDLPVRSALPALAEALAGRGSAVLVAPPGTGKTTLVPLALAGVVPGRILVAEPRRVAARAAARRMAALLGEQVGGRVGYSVRGDSRRSAATRVEVVTTGLLVRRLQADPELPGVDAVVLDECHERHLDTDLALAFGLDVRAALRPELQLLAMSATAQAERLAGLLGDDGRPAPVVEASGALHDVDVVWAPPTGPVDPPHGLRVDPRLLGHVAATVRRALDERSGDVLVFLPGAGEIGTVAQQLGGLDADVLPLHGRLPAAAQDAALRAGPPAPGRAGDRARGEQPDRARRPDRRRRRPGPGAAGRPGPRPGLAGHGAGVAGGGDPAGRPRRAWPPFINRSMSTGCRCGAVRATSTQTPVRCCPPGSRPWTGSTPTPILDRRMCCGSGRSSTAGMIAPSADADRAVRYLTKYLTKSVSAAYTDRDQADPAYQAHIDRLHDEVRWLPCSPGCANWLRYGIQPDRPAPAWSPAGATVQGA